MKRICIFCGSRPGRGDTFLALARSVGAELARRGIGIVYGGGRVGLMGALADAALEAGGEVIGVIPHALERAEIAHQGLTALHVVISMHERKAMMGNLSDAFLALPGGFGTMDELFEALTWQQLGYHDKPIALLDADNFFAPLLGLLQRMLDDDLLTIESYGRVRLARSLADALADPEMARALTSARGDSQ
uniref:Cytokinin riboside 5'-monophosphate phosphoribohydrolase n=1 Tax=mine drainage metagenome TaxID=410659 RepID=E6Q7L9_9ZZZZ